MLKPKRNTGIAPRFAGRYRECHALQATLADSTTGNTHRTSKERHDRYRRNRIWVRSVIVMLLFRQAFFNVSNCSHTAVFIVSLLHYPCHRKTCAFGLPVLQYLLYLPQNILNRVSEDGPLALVMAPTRELAIQIYGELQKLLSRQSQIKTCVVVGGQSIGQQAQQIREGVHIIVGTPGRINDCIEMAYLVLNQCCYIVLDEG